MILALLATIAAGQGFTCRAVSVWDGDGPIACAGGVKVRLAAVAAREMDGTCRRGHPCPAASGVAARDRLVQLLGGARAWPSNQATSNRHVPIGAVRLRCRSRGPDDYGRTVAWCSAPRVGDLSCALVRAGVAARWPRYGGAAVCRRG